MVSSSTGTFGYDWGGLSYYFKPKRNIAFNIDYIAGNFKFDDVIITSSDGTIQHN